MCIVGIAVDGGSSVSSIRPIILVKRSGKVAELEEEVNSMYLVLIYTVVMILVCMELFCG